MMGYCYNRMSTYVISGYVKIPAGYEFVVKDNVLKFLKDYGFEIGEFLYIEERDQHKGYDEKGHAYPRGVRFNVSFSDSIARREIKQISKQLKLYLPECRWINQFSCEYDNVVVKWGISDVQVASKDYNEDY